MDIREKIRKLLALGTSPNENEARAALLKAKELMAKHKLSEEDFGENKELKHFMCEDVSWTSDSGRIWMTELCKMLCDEYCCSSSWSVKKGGRTYTLIITGIGDDVEVCKEAVGYAVGFVESRIKNLQKIYRRQDPKSIANSYATGFINGLKLAFEFQKEEHPEWGLVVVKSDKVNEYEQSLGSRSVKTKQSSMDLTSYMKGQVDGKNFTARKPLTTS